MEGVHKNSMKVARVYDFDDIRVEEAPLPTIGPKEILVQAKACGICSGDVMPWYIRQKAPLVLGHEPAGVVAAVGADVQDFKVGDRVFVHHHAPCMTCHDCLRGNYSMCVTWKKSFIDPGGMAEFFRVPEGNRIHDTLLLPEGVSFAAGALVEPAACVVKAYRRARVHPGDTVVVIGLGIMGQMLAKLAKHYGADQVIAADLSESRCARARAIGLEKVVHSSQESLVETVSGATGGRMADVVIVGPPVMAALQEGLHCCGKGAKLLMFTPTPPGELWQVDSNQLYFNEISVIPSYSCGPEDTREALELLAQGILDPEELISHRYRLEEAPAAFRAMAGGGDVTKVLVEIG